MGSVSCVCGLASAGVSSNCVCACRILMARLIQTLVNILTADSAPRVPWVATSRDFVSFYLVLVFFGVGSYFNTWNALELWSAISKIMPTKNVCNVYVGQTGKISAWSSNFMEREDCYSLQLCLPIVCASRPDSLLMPTWIAGAVEATMVVTARCVCMAVVACHTLVQICK